MFEKTVIHFTDVSLNVRTNEKMAKADLFRACEYVKFL